MATVPYGAPFTPFSQSTPGHVGWQSTVSDFLNNPAPVYAPPASLNPPSIIGAWHFTGTPQPMPKHVTAQHWNAAMFSNNPFAVTLRPRQSVTQP